MRGPSGAGRGSGILSDDGHDNGCAGAGEPARSGALPARRGMGMNEPGFLPRTDPFAMPCFRARPAGAGGEVDR